MNTTRDGRHAELIRLTEVAAEAARIGRWDEAIQCYHERGILLESMPGVTVGTDELLKMDEHVRQCAHAAQAVLVTLLSEATATRQRLRGLRQRLSAPKAISESVSLEA